MDMPEVIAYIKYRLPYMPWHNQRKKGSGIAKKKKDSFLAISILLVCEIFRSR